MSAGRWSLADIRALAQRTETLVKTPVITRSKLPTRQRMNKLESAYAQRLELERHAGLWQWWAFEPITLRLAADARYTPDFGLIDVNGDLVLHETKGFWREAALVRIKVAAELYPFFRFVAVTRRRKRDGGAWVHKAV